MTRQADVHGYNIYKPKKKYRIGIRCNTQVSIIIVICCQTLLFGVVYLNMTCK